MSNERSVVVADARGRRAARQPPVVEVARVRGAAARGGRRAARGRPALRERAARPLRAVGRRGVRAPRRVPRHVHELQPRVPPGPGDPRDDVVRRVRQVPLHGPRPRPVRRSRARSRRSSRAASRSATPRAWRDLEVPASASSTEPRPFECVGDADECATALVATAAREDRADQRHLAALAARCAGARRSTSSSVARGPTTRRCSMRHAISFSDLAGTACRRLRPRRRGPRGAGPPRRPRLRRRPRRRRPRRARDCGGVLATAEGGARRARGVRRGRQVAGHLALPRRRRRARATPASRCSAASACGSRRPTATRVICVTGTKGKSTVDDACSGTSPRASGRRASSRATSACRPSTRASSSTGRLVVVETSSFQATDVAHSPAVVAVTSLGEDHLDWHGSVARYHADKLSLTTPARRAAHRRRRHRRRCASTEGCSAARWPGSDPRRRRARRGARPRRGATARRTPRSRSPRCGPPASTGSDDADRLVAAAHGYRAAARAVPRDREARRRPVHRRLARDEPAADDRCTRRRRRRQPLALLVGGHDRGVDYDELVAAIARGARATLVVTLPDNGPRSARSSPGAPRSEVVDAGDVADAVAIGDRVARRRGHRAALAGRAELLAVPELGGAIRGVRRRGRRARSADARARAPGGREVASAAPRRSARAPPRSLVLDAELAVEGERGRTTRFCEPTTTSRSRAARVVQSTHRALAWMYTGRLAVVDVDLRARARRARRTPHATPSCRSWSRATATWRRAAAHERVDDVGVATAPLTRGRSVWRALAMSARNARLGVRAPDEVDAVRPGGRRTAEPVAVERRDDRRDVRALGVDHPEVPRGRVVLRGEVAGADVRGRAVDDQGLLMEDGPARSPTAPRRGPQRAVENAGCVHRARVVVLVEEDLDGDVAALARPRGPPRSSGRRARTSPRAPSGARRRWRRDTKP